MILITNQLLEKENPSNVQAQNSFPKIQFWMLYLHSPFLQNRWGCLAAPLGFPFGSQWCACNQREISLDFRRILWEFPPCLLHFLQCQVQRIPGCLCWKWLTGLWNPSLGTKVWRRKTSNLQGTNLKGSLFSRKFPSLPCLEPADFLGGASTFMLKCKNFACTQRTHKSLAGDM